MARRAISAAAAVLCIMASSGTPGRSYGEEQAGDILKSGELIITVHDENGEPVRDEAGMIQYMKIGDWEVDQDYTATVNITAESGEFYSNAYYQMRVLHTYPKKLIFTGPVRSLDIEQMSSLSCNVEDITFPDTIEYVHIGDSAFDGAAISGLTLNGSCEIGEMTFRDNARMNSLCLTGDSTVLGKFAFSGCSTLEEAELNNVTADRRAFAKCTSLKSVKFTGTAKLSDSVFAGCTALENIDIDIEKADVQNAFIDCPYLRTINSKPVFDPSTGDIVPEYRDFVLNNFKGSYSVGFLDDYILAQADKIAGEVTDSTMTDVEKAKALHDWICRKVSYDYGENEVYSKNHSDGSVFLNDSSQCEGYAKAYNLLLHAAGMESWYVASKDHAWNVVKLDGHYFHIDTTWDDGEETSYDWFMLTDEEMRAAGGLHESWAARIPTNLHDFQSPELPECSTPMGDLNADGAVTIADLVKMSRCILGNDTIAPEDAVLADLDPNGRADAFDLCRLRKKLIAE